MMAAIKRCFCAIVLLVFLLLFCTSCFFFETDSNDSDNNDDYCGTGLDDDDGSKESEQCADRNPQRNLYFGDLHAHTKLSWDAYGYDVRVTPDQAYRFAKGHTIYLSPLDSDGNGTRAVQLARPLDFVAITDHSEYLAEVRLCTEPGTTAYISDTCTAYREGGSAEVTRFGLKLASSTPQRFEDICNAGDCPEKLREVWAEVITAAETARSDGRSCSFETFPAYEYTATPQVSNLHRNVLFAGPEYPEQPISYFEANTPEELWSQLRELCLDEVNCDAITVPHNSNWSNGKLYHPYDAIADPEAAREQAELRLEMEPMAEVMQHKGDMECKNGFEDIPDDPLCGFEQFRGDDFPDCGEGTGMGGANGLGCVSKYDYLRNVFLAGLSQYQAMGIDPFAMGMIGSTDTHNGIPGAVDEWNYLGHVGSVDDTPEENLSMGTITHSPLISNPGGLTAVWSTENRRDALFEAFRRKEVYSTSGTRIRVRFFAVENAPSDGCESVSVESALSGVPMGGQIGSSDQAPTFVAVAEQDPGTEDRPGTPLQRIQIIKGWADIAGETHFEVFEVAGDPDNGAAVDTETCEEQGTGFDSLCAVWTDPAFDPNEPAFYYVRVVEYPSCRWSTYLCNEMPEAQRPDACSDPAIPKAVQERAVTSPIRYYPLPLY